MNKNRRFLSWRVGALLLASAMLALFLLGTLWVLGAATGWPLWPAALGTLLAAGGGLLFWRRVYRPYKETERIFGLFAAGYTFEGIFEVEHQLSPGAEKALLHVREMLNTDAMLNASKRQAQYLALQNQINPHFLYNTLEGIRGEALAAGSESIASMTEALSTFFRYTISKLENLATLEEELANVENYFIIQQYRFGRRLSLAVEFESEEDRRLLLACRLPKLTLQPIVENAIIHGLEGKVGPGRVTVRVQGTEKRVLITVKDDGLGMDAVALEAMRRRLNAPFADNTRAEREGKGGIAIPNVNHRIGLLFGEGYGLDVYSTPGQGTDVEVTLPYITRGENGGQLA